MTDIFAGVVLKNPSSDPPDTVVNRALMVFAHGQGCALCWSGGIGVSEYISEMGGVQDFFETSEQVDFEDPGDGLYIVDLKLVDDGPGDYPGTRECVLGLRNFRKATKEEWAAHCMGDWPWDINGQENVHGSSEDDGRGQAGP